MNNYMLTGKPKKETFFWTFDLPKLNMEDIENLD